MLSNFFTDLNYAQVVERLKRLEENASRKWGTMNPAQMLRHCRSQIDFILAPPAATEVLKTPFRFAPVRWLSLFVVPWPQNAKTAPEMDVNKKLTDVQDFETEKRLLLEGLQNLYHAGNAEAVHPLFGKMGKNQWGRVVWKHLDHHLRQFGL